MPDATPTGVSGASADASGIPDLNDPNLRMDRGSAMKAMAARRHLTVQEDLGETERAAFAATPAAPIVATEDEDAESNAADEARRQLEAQAAATARDDGANREREAAARAAADAARAEPAVLEGDALETTRVRIKVNGVEQIVTAAEALRMAQKNSAADQYLEQARSIVQEVRAVAAQVKAAATPAAGAAAATPSTDTGNTTSEPDSIDVAVDALFQGDDKKVKEQLRKAIGSAKPAGQGVDADALSSQVEQRVVIRSALKQFAKDHKTIADDPRARQIADSFLQAELTQRGVTALEQLPLDDIGPAIDAAGRRTKDYFREKAGVPQAAVVDTAGMGERRNKKQAIDELPAASTRAASGVPQPQTTSDVIARMKAARPGQLGSA